MLDKTDLKELNNSIRKVKSNGFDFESDFIYSTSELYEILEKMIDTVSEVDSDDDYVKEIKKTVDIFVSKNMNFSRTYGLRKEHEKVISSLEQLKESFTDVQMFLKKNGVI